MRAAWMIATSVLALSGLQACGNDSEPENTGTSENELQLDFPSFEVPTGESFKCFYTDVITKEELSVVSALGAQGNGGHHLSLYYVDNPRDVGVQDCDGKSEMVDWHFVVGAGGEGNANNTAFLPEGMAFKVPAGKQLMVQSHYINTSGAAEEVVDKMTIKTADPESIENYAADFVVDDETWVLEPHSDLTSTTECEVPEDVSLVMLLGHMHEHGAHFRLERLDEKGEVADVLYEQDWQAQYASHPPINNYDPTKPLELKKGTKLRQTCTWKNDGADTLAFPTEMCIGFGFYFPGTSRIECQAKKVP